MSAVGDEQSLDELENHLREETDVLARAGIEAAEAFKLAKRRMGRAQELGNEFHKARKNEKEQIMKKALFITAGVVGVLIGMAFVMPAVALWRNTGALAAADAGLLALGLVLTLGGLGTATFAARRRVAQ
jgi:hypothetical protein